MTNRERLQSAEKPAHRLLLLPRSFFPPNSKTLSEIHSRGTKQFFYFLPTLNISRCLGSSYIKIFVFCLPHGIFSDLSRSTLQGCWNHHFNQKEWTKRTSQNTLKTIYHQTPKLRAGLVWRLKKINKLSVKGRESLCQLCTTFLWLYRCCHIISGWEKTVKEIWVQVRLHDDCVVNDISAFQFFRREKKSTENNKAAIPQDQRAGSW